MPQLELPSRGDRLAQIDELQRDGLYVQALRRLQELSPEGKIDLFTVPEERVMAARLAHHAGAPELSLRILRRAYHANRTHPETIYYYSRRLLERRGPLVCLHFQETHGDLNGASEELQSDWLAQRGLVWSTLRDFAEAQRWLDRARAMAPRNPWVLVEQAGILESQDRYAEARDIIDEALRLRPWHRASVQSAAQIRQYLGDDAGALELLRGAAGRMESSYILLQLAALEQELGLYHDARATMERLPEVAPLMEKEYFKWHAFRRFDLAYWCGDLPAAVEIGVALEPDFIKETVARLKTHLAENPAVSRAGSLDDNPPYRVRLNVGFVRQHKMTCVPATLATLCRYWNCPADHLAIAEAICYDGTPHHKERAWADKAGFITREFTLTWEVGVALIDRGVPFILTTTGTERGHAQAIIGYDAFRRSFLVRDPYARGSVEFIAGKMLEHFRSSGPRCVMILPKNQIARIEGIVFPESDLYDFLHVLQASLEVHDRPAAQEAHKNLRAAAPAHRITHYATRCLAGYDANRSGALAATEELIKLFPADAGLQLMKLAGLRDLARRHDRVDLLRKICTTKGSDSVFWQRLAEELMGDARESGVADRLLQRRLRRAPGMGAPYALLAQALWDRREFQRAFLLFRIAACMDDKHEGSARNYFAAARHFRKTDEALAFLRDRFNRFGNLSSAPGRTLFEALSQINHETEAAAVLEESLQRRPNDAELLAYAANVHVRHQKIEKGLELLKKAEPIAHRLGWLYSAAEIEDLRCQPEESLALWRQIAQQDPLSINAHRAIARLIAETQGRAPALDYLHDLTERFPHHFGIMNLLILWQRGEVFEVREATVRRLIAIDPDEAWGYRELALLLSEAGRDDQAMAAMQQAQLLEPDDARTVNVMVTVHENAGRHAEARQWALRAVEMSVDNQLGIDALMRLARSTEERRNELQFVQQELMRQVIFGDSLLAFRRVAGRVLDAAEVTARLREAHAARPDLWHAWSALICQHIGTQEFAEAERLAREAVERFPLTPRLWLDLSQVYAAKGELDARAAALQEALAIAPAWGVASRMLATVHETRGDIAEARRCLERAAAREPLDHYNHADLAQALWKLGQRAQAIERLERALNLNAGEQFHWDLLGRWGKQQGKPNLAIEKARDLTRRRAGDPETWRRLARLLPAKEPETLEAIDKAIILEPRNPAGHDLRATILAFTGRLIEAGAACKPAIFGPHIPSTLRARAAWIAAKSGRTGEAITAMRAVLEVDQSNLWAWQRLCDWLYELRRSDEYLETCQRVAKLWPGDASVLEYLAHARLQPAPKDVAQRRLAKAELRRSLEIDPDRIFAADRLLDLHLEDNEAGSAELALRFIRQQSRESAALLGQVRVALVSGDTPASVEAAVSAARKLFDLPAARYDDLQRLRSVIKSHRSARARIEEALLQAASTPGCGEFVPATAVEFRTEGGNWESALEIVRRFPQGSKPWQHACRAFFIASGKRRRSDHAAKLVHEQHQAMRQNIEIWGIISYTFDECGRWNDTIRWMSDYRDRKDAQPWMLENLGEAFTAMRRHSEAAAVHMRALALPPDKTREGHLIWLAIQQPGSFTAANAALPDAAATPFRFSLEGIDPAQLVAEKQLLLHAARVRVALATPEKSPVTKKQLEDAWKQMGKQLIAVSKSKLVKPIYRVTCWRVARKSGNPLMIAQAVLRLIRL